MTVQRALPKRTLASASPSGASAGSISSEWKACETRSARVSSPCASRWRVSVSTSARAPLTTTCCAPLKAAKSRRSPSVVIVSRTRASPAGIDAMAPSPGRFWVSRPRRATTRSASSSGKMPATQAAAYSPRLWPSTSAGSMPQERHSAASATWVANSAGWAMAVSSSRVAWASPYSSSSKGVSSRPSSTAAQ